MAAKKSSPTFEFTRQYLEQKPDAEFAEVQAAAQNKNLKVIPVIYGRAKKALGLAKPASKSPGRAPAASPEPRTAARRGRPPKAARPAGGGPALDTLEGAIQAMRQNDAERERFRHALERIRDLVQDALA